MNQLSGPVQSAKIISESPISGIFFSLCKRVPNGSLSMEDVCAQIGSLSEMSTVCFIYTFIYVISKSTFEGMK